MMVLGSISAFVRDVWNLRQLREDALMGVTVKEVTRVLDMLEAKAPTREMAVFTQGMPTRTPEDRAAALSELIAQGINAPVRANTVGTSGINPASQPVYSVHFSRVRLALPPNLVEFVQDPRGFWSE